MSAVGRSDGLYRHICRMVQTFGGERSSWLNARSHLMGSKMRRYSLAPSPASETAPSGLRNGRAQSRCTAMSTIVMRTSLRQ
jgi:uncharacterized protein (UPF0548 family)